MTPSKAAGNQPVGSASSFASTETHVEVSAFLAREAELIDDRQFGEWLGLVTEDFTYKMPVPVTPDNPGVPAYDESALVIDENRHTLADHWFSRFEPDMWEMAWAENPPVRYRHFITNVRVREADAAGEYDVRSNAIVTGSRQSDQPTPLYIERFDTLIDADGFRLKSRFVVAEGTLIDFAQLRVVL